MIIGVPKEIKNHEYRVGLVTSSVRELTSLGHQVLVETQAGVGIGLSDSDYENAGATIISNAKEVFTRSEMIVKVKEPQAVERAMLNEGQILFTYLHLAPDFPQTKDLIDSKAVCIAYETVTDSSGKLPLLAPMSEVAGRMSIQAGAQTLENSNGGRGPVTQWCARCRTGQCRHFGWGGRWFQCRQNGSRNAGQCPLAGS